MKDLADILESATLEELEKSKDQNEIIALEVAMEEADRWIKDGFTIVLLDKYDTQDKGDLHLIKSIGNKCCIIKNIDGMEAAVKPKVAELIYRKVKYGFWKAIVIIVSILVLVIILLN